MRHFDLNVGDWIAATAHLSDVEEAVYLRLLLSYYSREAPLPADRDACRRLARASSKEARKAVDVVLAEFFYESGDGWHQKRADAEIERFYDKSSKAKESARISAEVRKRQANAKRTHSERISERSADGVANDKLPMTHDPLPMTHDEPPYPVSVVPPLPGNLSAATWDGWLRHRAEKGRPTTPTERAYTLANLGLHADPEAAVRTAIEAGWSRIDPPGGRQSSRAPPNGRETAKERGLRNMDEITGQANGNRTIEGTAERVDSPTLLPAAGNLRVAS